MADVEKLFQSSSIAAVREVETRTRHEIEEKKRQLRQVVGDSYRDLISSADTIIDISRSCHRLVDLAGSLQAGLGALAGSVAAHQHAESAAAAAAAAAPAASSYDRLYALGSRIKYLIDTPETIYGCLDGGEHLAAARRFVRAAEVHRLLTAGQPKQVAQRFPLLQHQWPLVKKFRPQVFAAAGAWLGSHGELTAPQAASTLAAQALLKPMDGAEASAEEEQGHSVLKAFLTARQAYIMQCLSAATGAGADTDLDSLAFILADVATMVCATVAQCGELFLQLPGVSATPLLAQALASDDGSSVDLLFDSAGKEAEAWKANVEAVQGRLAELSAAGLALECSQWLDQLSQALRQLGGTLLGPCASGQGLLSVEAAVKAALEDWQYSLQAGRPDSEADEAQAAAPPTGVAMSWADVCQWVLGRPSPLWPLLFEQPLLERAKELVGRDFSAVVDEVTDLLGGALQEAAGLPPSAPGSFQAGRWSDMVELQPATPEAAPPVPAAASKRRRTAGPPKPAAGAAAQAGGVQTAALAQGWLPKAEHVVRRFDAQLTTALEAALHACGGGGLPAAEAGSGDAAAARRPAGLAESAASRAAVLEPFVQDRCAEAAEGIAAALDARLLALPKHQEEGGEDAAAAFAPTATQALILGRVALGMASRSSMLPLVLGPPDQWRTAARASSGGGDATGRPLLVPRHAAGSAAAPGAAARVPSPRYEQLQRRLHSVGLQAYGAWAGWASSGLVAALAAGLAADQALAADTPLRSWEETVIDSGDGGAAGGAELAMRFQLPAAPSPATMQLALAACQEADRAGGHLLEDEALLLFKWSLGGALLAALGAELAPGGGGGEEGAAQERERLGARLSEKGVLQLLFDTRFLLDLLAGGRPVGAAGAADPASSGAAVAARRRQGSQLEAALSARLDPIDWATYEPYLYGNKGRAAARCQVLFGLLLRGDRAPAAGAGAGPSASGGMPADSNILRMAPVGPRLSYLPVTTPGALLRHGSQPLHHAAAAGSASGAAQARLGPGLGLGLAGSAGDGSSAAGSEVSASAYSFASLQSGGSRAVRQEGPAGEAAASSSVGGGVASKLAGFGDQLVAQLGDMSAAQGLLSSLGARFNK